MSSYIMVGLSSSSQNLHADLALVLLLKVELQNFN